MLRKKHMLGMVTLFLSVSAYAQGGLAPVAPASATPQSSYAGYSINFFSDPLLSPYGIMTPSDVYPLVSGYGITRPGFDPSGINVPFYVNFPTPSAAQPNIAAPTPTDLLVGAMLLPIPDDQIKAYLTQMDSAFSGPSLSSGTSFNSSSIINIKAPNSYNYIVTPGYAKPYNADSLFHYAPNSLMPGQNPQDNPAAYQVNPAEVYISLVSGLLTPDAMPKNPTGDYMIKVRRLAAAQTAGVNALQDIYNRSLPLNGFDTATFQQLSNDAGWNGQKPPVPANARELEKFMATRRLDPNSGWFNHVQQASPVELQREQLYLEAEMLSEMQKLHHTEEQNQLLLAVNLLMQNTSARDTMNQEKRVSDSAADSTKSMQAQQNEQNASQK